MLENIDLTCETSKEEYKKLKPDLEIQLAGLQRQAKDLGIPLVIVFEGWDAAGKGTLINELILPLDPRGFIVYNARPPNEEEALRPFLWRFWNRTPERGRITVFDRSWYRRVLDERVEGKPRKTAIERSFEDIRAFERQLADDGCVIIKFFLHISKAEQKRRFKKLLKHKATTWRVTRADLKRHKLYNRYFKAANEMISRTDSEFAPWTVVEATDRRYATLKIFHAVTHALSRRIEQAKARRKAAVTVEPPDEGLPMSSSLLDKVDLSVTIERDAYRRALEEKQDRLRELEHEIYTARIPVVLAYEGWDAAGKGGNLRRLTQKLDPRGYEVVPVAAPNDIEKKHHYLWRFWTRMPKAGHITIFDRTWYGRVLVERVEGFCSEAEWKRAYREINEMERHMVNFGTVLLKFWIHIDPDEQLRRFKERQKDPHKRWKITDEDWRNREKRPQYEAAVREMLLRTSTPLAPWTVVESNCKWYARLKVLDTVINAIEDRL